jgi:hypothetical protein
MTLKHLAAIVFATTTPAVIPLHAMADPAMRTWTFESDPVDAPPANFTLARTGSGPPGRWVVRREPGAPSGWNVLAQVDTDDTSSRFPLAVADEPSPQNLRLSIKCKAVSGKVDRAAGVVFRYRDEQNYYVARANALEDNVRLYYVKAGRRQQLASWSGKVSSDAWHELGVEARDDHIQVFWDGEKVIDARDSTFPEAGRVGVWTKADSITLFDDFEVEVF